MSSLLVGVLTLEQTRQQKQARSAGSTNKACTKLIVSVKAMKLANVVKKTTVAPRRKRLAMTEESQPAATAEPTVCIAAWIRSSFDSDSFRVAT